MSEEKSVRNLRTFRVPVRFMVEAEHYFQGTDEDEAIGKAFGADFLPPRKSWTFVQDSYQVIDSEVEELEEEV